MAAVQATPAEPLLHRGWQTVQRVPFVAVLVVLLGAGLAGALWLNTLTDEAGLRTSDARRSSAGLQLQIEELNADISARNSTDAIAVAARRLGMVPAGDSAILLVPDDGGPAVLVGTPTPVVDPAAVAAEAARAAAEAEAARVAAAQAAQAQEAAQADAAAQAQAAAAAAADAAAAAAAAAVPPDPGAAPPAGTIEGAGQ